MSDSIFTDGTLIARDKLGMVNICLNAIGEIPLESGTVLSELQPGTDGAIARDLVSKTMLEIQTPGWFFNIDRNFELVPDANGFIAVPVNLLRVDVGNTSSRSKIDIRNGKLYKIDTQDFIFTESLFADVTWLIDYADLSFTAWNYIAYRSATLFEKATIASPDLGANTKVNEANALAMLQREDIQYRDMNLLPRVVNRNSNPRWGQD